MVANFAMSVLNGVGGAKLEKIVPVTNLMNTTGASKTEVVALGKTYKYLILEIYDAIYINSSSTPVKALDLSNGTQLFIIVGNDLIYLGATYLVNDTSGSIESVKVVNTNLNINMIIGGRNKDYFKYSCNLYCFN